MLLAQPDESNKIGYRNSFLMFLLYDSGCRIQEILDLKLKDFLVNKGFAELHIVGKGNKFRVTPISQELIPKFEKYCYYYHKDKDYNEYMFYTIRNGIHTRMSCDNASYLTFLPHMDEGFHTGYHTTPGVVTDRNKRPGEWLESMARYMRTNGQDVGYSIPDVLACEQQLRRLSRLDADEIQNNHGRFTGRKAGFKRKDREAC